MGFKITFCCIALLRMSWSYETPELKNSDLSYNFGKSEVFLELTLAAFNSGEEMLTNLDDEIRKEMNITKNTNILETYSEKYYGLVNNYVDIINKLEITSYLDRELVVLNFVESTNKILVDLSNNLTQELVAELNKNDSSVKEYNSFKFNTIVENISNYIEKAACDVKRDQFEYICSRFDICRRFPAYSDHIVEILDEIIALPDAKFLTAVKLLEETFKMKAFFFWTIMDDRIAESISNFFSPSENDQEIIRKRLILVRDALENKYKIIKNCNKNDSNKIRKKALRILIAIFDKAFEQLTEESIRSEIDEVITSIKTWKSYDYFDIHKVIMDYVANVEDILESVFFDESLRYNTKALIELLVKGSSKFDIEFDLMNNGPKFLKRGNTNIPLGIENSILFVRT